MNEEYDEEEEWKDYYDIQDDVIELLGDYLDLPDRKYLQEIRDLFNGLIITMISWKIFLRYWMIKQSPKNNGNIFMSLLQNFQRWNMLTLMLITE